MRRREFIGSLVGAATAAPLIASPPQENVLLGGAEHCVMIWLGGGMAQIDTFDPKMMGDVIA